MIAGAAGLTATAALGGCARAPADRIDLWAMGTEAAKLPRILGVALPALASRIKVQALPWTAAHGKLLTSYAGNSLPLVGQMGNTWIAEMVALGALQPVPQDRAALVEDQFPAVLDTNRINGKLYGVPWYVDARVQFYRKDILARAGYDAPPQRWAEWKAMLERVVKTNRAGRFAILMPLNEHEHLLTLALSANAAFVRDKGTRGAFAAPEFVEALGFYNSLFGEGLAPVASAAEIANSWAEFARGSFAVYPSGPWNVSEMRNRFPAALQDKWGTAPNPGPNGIGTAAAGGASLVVYAGHDNPQTGWDVIEGLLGLPAQTALQQITGDLPSRRAAWQATGLATDPVMAAFSTQLDHARAVPKLPEWERIVTEMQIVADHMVRGELSVKAAAAEIDRRADALLAKRRWMLGRGA